MSLPCHYSYTKPKKINWSASSESGAFYKLIQNIMHPYSWEYINLLNFNFTSSFEVLICFVLGKSQKNFFWKPPESTEWNSLGHNTKLEVACPAFGFDWKLMFSVNLFYQAVQFWQAYWTYLAGKTCFLLESKSVAYNLPQPMCQHATIGMKKVKMHQLFVKLMAITNQC